MNKEQLEQFVKDSTNFSQVLKKYGLKTYQGNYETLKKYINYYKIDVSHFNRKNLKNYNDLKEIKIEQILNNEIFVSSNRLKQKLLKNNLLKYECTKCFNKGVWNKTKLILQLDHIDGNKFNNSLSNLRLLCPNCHSQTSTFAGKNAKNKTFQKTSHKKIKNPLICPNCSNKVSKNGCICKTCLSLNNKRKNPNSIRNRILKDFESFENFVILLKNKSYLHFANFFKVSDNAIRKIIKSEGYCPKTFKKNSESGEIRTP